MAETYRVALEHDLLSDNNVLHATNLAPLFPNEQSVDTMESDPVYLCNNARPLLPTRLEKYMNALIVITISFILPAGHDNLPDLIRDYKRQKRPQLLYD